MLVTLNAFRDGRSPGETVDLPDGDAAALIAHGAAFAADDTDAEPDKQAKTGKASGRRTVRAKASMQAASQTQDGEAHGEDDAAP